MQSVRVTAFCSSCACEWKHFNHEHCLLWGSLQSFRTEHFATTGRITDDVFACGAFASRWKCHAVKIMEHLMKHKPLQWIQLKWGNSHFLNALMPIKLGLLFFFSSRAENHLPKSAVCFMIFPFLFRLWWLAFVWRATKKQARECILDVSQPWHWAHITFYLILEIWYLCISFFNVFSIFQPVDGRGDAY